MTTNKLAKLKHDGHSIRAVINNNEAPLWLCLNDLLKYLDRMELIENGKFTKICKSYTRLPFKEGGRNRWAIKPYDVHYLVSSLAFENNIIAAKCEKLMEWANSLPISMSADVGMPTSGADDEVVIFNYQDQFPITFKSDSGKTYVNATQMAVGFGKSTFDWLSLDSVAEYREAMISRGESHDWDSQIFVSADGDEIWIEESLAMEFARWLSPDFSLWCNSKIKELVNDGYATLRPKPKHTQPKVSEVFVVPKTLDEALQLAAEQARRLRESEHKISFYDEYVEDRTHFKSSRIADELEISVVTLHRFLAEEGIVHFEREKKRWVVNGPYRPLQCDAPYMWQREDGKVYPFGSVKRWTQAGREYIIELWNERNGGYVRK